MTRRKLYLWIQAALCVLLFTLLAAGAVSIFREGMRLRAEGDLFSWIYTREKVSGKLRDLLPLFCGAAGFLAAGLVLNGRDEKSPLPSRDVRFVRNLVCRRVSVPSAEMKKEQKRQKKIRLAGITGAAVCALPVLLYMLNGSHFESQDLEEMMGKALLHIVPWIAIGFGILALSERAIEKSLIRETKLAGGLLKNIRAVSREQKFAENGNKTMKKCDPAAGDGKLTETGEESGKNLKTAVRDRKLMETDEDNPGSGSVETGKQPVTDYFHENDRTTRKASRCLAGIRFALLGIAVCLIIHGVMNGSMRDVLYKAMNICTECIGLG